VQRSGRKRQPFYVGSRREDVAVGARIRVWPGPRNAWFVGTVTGATRDSLYIQPCETCPAKPIARFDVTQLHVSEGRKKFNWERAGVGLLVAGTLGAIMGYQTGSEIDEGCTFLCLAAPQFMFQFGLIGSTAGFLVGGLTGGEKWR
jgi:hypothetical protein